jgi:hypothetical protein
MLKLSTLGARGAPFGLVGALVIRLRTRRRLAILYAALIASTFTVAIIRLHGVHRELLTSFGFALGWCAGLLVYPHSERMLMGAPVSPEQGAKAKSAAA